MGNIVERARSVVMELVEAFLDEVAQLADSYSLLEDEEVVNEFRAFVSDEGGAADTSEERLDI